MVDQSIPLDEVAMGSGMSRETRFGARTPLVAIPTVATALQGCFPAVTARADTARPGDAAAHEIGVGETVTLPSPGGRATFESGDPRVATVTEGGVVTGVGEGRATIRATIAMPGIGGRLWERALTIIGRVPGERDPIAQTVTRESCVVVRPKADGRPAGSDGDGLTDLDEATKHRTDPHAKDTDFDGLSDIRQGSVEGSVAKPEVSCVQYAAEGGI